MTFWRSATVLVLSLTMLVNCVPLAKACGPESIEPIFVFKESPDLPFEEFARGKIGILQPTFGRKTLVIAYRYINGGSFTSEGQQALVEALRGKSPVDSGPEAIEAWIAARKEVRREEDKLPEIYTERQYGGYDFFPNCTKNAFEVATQTLKDRVTRFGAEDRHVSAWLAAQDIVFQNCAGGTSIPEELGAESPAWLRKDREYQIGAALFYSLKFDEARSRFEKISADHESGWQQTAEYLVARTLIRQASLTEDDAKKRELYGLAESHLATLLRSGGQFFNASKKLSALVKYRLRPQERVRELAQVLAHESGNENLRQDLIDYVWLLDKFEAQALKEEEKRKDAAKLDKNKEQSKIETKGRSLFEAIESGEVIPIYFAPKSVDGKPDYANSVNIRVAYDTPESEIIQTIEDTLGRKLTSEEVTEIRVAREAGLEHRQRVLAPNHRLFREARSQYEGHYSSDRLTLDLVPTFLHADDLSDWILTFQTADPAAYARSLSKWRETNSRAWLVTALTKAQTTSPAVNQLINQAEKVSPEAAAFPTVAYHLIRLKTAFGKTDEARKLLEDVLSSQFDALPVSARNLFIEQRMRLAQNLTDFLNFAGRKPVVFWNSGLYLKMRDLLAREKSFWNPKNDAETKEEYDRRIDEVYVDLLPWDDRVLFDERTIDILNWHFPLSALMEAARNPALPHYLQRRVVNAVWTRAILLGNDEVGLKIAPEVVKLAPEMRAAFIAYQDARTANQRKYAALYILLKFPNMSPLVTGGIPTWVTTDESDYYFENAWWCRPSETEYTDQGVEIPKVVAKPAFLTPVQLEAARRERAAIIALGNGKSYLGKRALAWARTSPRDTRVPEVLFIAAKANDTYKYGCGAWESDEKTKEAAEALLRRRYPRSPWTAKLAESEN